MGKHVNIDLSKRCGAKKKNGEICKGQALPNGRCKFHGGMNIPPGPDHPNYKTGKYSKFLPKKLLETYEQSLNDPNLLALKQEIAVIDSRIVELLGKVDQGEAGELWKKLKDKYRSCLKEEDGVKQTMLLSDLGQLINCGYKDHMTWGEIYVVLEQRKKLVESERKRYIEMGQMITAEQAAILISQVSKLITDNVEDRETLLKITHGLSGMLGRLSKPIELD